MVNLCAFISRSSAKAYNLVKSAEKPCDGYSLPVLVNKRYAVSSIKLWRWPSQQVLPKESVLPAL